LHFEPTASRQLPCALRSFPSSELTLTEGGWLLFYCKRGLSLIERGGGVLVDSARRLIRSEGTDMHRASEMRLLAKWGGR
jgi:hypothetical protein